MNSSKTTGANEQRNKVPHEAFDDGTSSVKKVAAALSSSKETLPLALAPRKNTPPKKTTSAGETLPSAKETANDWSPRKKNSIALSDPVGTLSWDNEIAGDGAMHDALSLETMSSSSMAPLLSPSKGANAAYKSLGHRSRNAKTAASTRVTLSPNAEQPLTPSSGQQAEAVVEAAVEQHLALLKIEFTMMTCTSRSSSTTEKYRIHIAVVAPDDVKYTKMTPMERLRLVTDPLRGFKFIEGPLTGTFATEGEIKKTNDKRAKVLEAAEKELNHMEEHTLGSSGSNSKTNPFQLLDENVKGNAEEKTLEFNAETAVGPKKEITPEDFPTKSKHLADQILHLSGQFQSFDSGVAKDPLANAIKTARNIGKEALSKVISNQCGTCVDNFGHEVDFLVVGREPSRVKYNLAIELGIRIITVIDLHRVVAEKTTLDELKSQSDTVVDRFAKVIKRKMKQAAAAPTSLKRKKRG